MNRCLRRCSLFAVALLPVACSTGYDFDQARLPNGGWDFPKLIADYQAGGETKLSQGSWFPLIHLRVREFGRTADLLEGGFAVSDFRAFGPLFLAGSVEKRVVGSAAEPVESADNAWFGWGLLYHSQQEVIETTHGPRRHDHHRTLLLFGKTATRYDAGEVPGDQQ